VDSKRVLGAEELAHGPDGTGVAGLTELPGAFCDQAPDLRFDPHAGDASAQDRVALAPLPEEPNRGVGGRCHRGHRPANRHALVHEGGRGDLPSFALGAELGIGPQSHIVEVSLGAGANTLAEFRAGLASVDASAIYFHMVEARARLGRRAGDFAEWIRTSLGMPELADRIERIDTYMTSLERVRARVLALVDAALDGGAR